MYENVYGKTPPTFGKNAFTLPLDVHRPCLAYKPHILSAVNGLCIFIAVDGSVAVM